MGAFTPSLKPTPRFSRLFSSVAALLLATATAAHAAPIVITDQMDSSATFQGGDYAGYASANFADRVAGGRHWGDELYSEGHRFDTTQMTVDRNDTAHTLTLTLHTQFNGNDDGAKYADLFIDTNTPNAPDRFNYAIALGYQTKSAGLYSVGIAATANDIWGSQGSYAYGGYSQFKTSSSDFDAGIAVPSTTRLVSGAAVAGSTVGVTRTDAGGGFFDITVALQAASLALFNNFDLFWGTGDCGNDTIWGNVAFAATADSPVDTPAALTLLTTGLLGVMTLRRRTATRLQS